MAHREEQALLAGGCFWGLEDLLRKQKGVLRTEVGYTGGVTPNATYNQVKTGLTDHAESVKITFDPDQTTYENILFYFFKIHDPTTRNRQGNDVGSQYRSAIFYYSEEQKQAALKVIEKVNAAAAWPGPVVTQVLPAGEFFSAEEYHQKYLEKNPMGYTCHFERPLKF